MKYRRNKVKREHGIIQDALIWLEELGRSSEVNDIIPGVIQVSRSPERGIAYKYETQTGCKILLKSNGSIQEAFVVTKNPDFVRQWVENHFPMVTHQQLSESNDKYNDRKTGKEDQTRKKQSSSKLLANSLVETSKITSKIENKKSKAKKKSPCKSSTVYKYVEQEDLPSLGQRLNSESRKALKALQINLNQSNTRRKKD
jgi:hypothetical protein